MIVAIAAEVAAALSSLNTVRGSDNVLPPPPTPAITAGPGLMVQIFTQGASGAGAATEAPIKVRGGKHSQPSLRSKKKLWSFIGLGRSTSETGA